MATGFVLDVYDGDLQNVSSGETVDPYMGLKLKVYSPSGEQLATVLLNDDTDNGGLVLTVYRDEDIPLGIRTQDYFPNLFNTEYTVLRDR